MKRPVSLVALLFVLAGCQSNPYSGRSQFLLLSEGQEVAMGVEAFAQVSDEVPRSDDPRFTEPLLRVGAAISRVADEMRAEQGKAPYEWEFVVIEDPKTLNAWCMPGGKIAFYTGIYPVLEDEAGMAIVMGHEVCHALLRHGGERVSQDVVAKVGLSAMSEVLNGSTYGATTMAALGMGAQLGVLLPFSRKHETEADRLGLELAARAGYDPRAAIRVWQNMSEAGSGRVPEILSTHPDPGHRIENMSAWMPAALQLYEQSAQKPRKPR